MINYYEDICEYNPNDRLRGINDKNSCPDRPEPCGWKQSKSTLPNPQILYGALVSGPNLYDHYEDTREESLYSEVSLDYNAGFQSALAGLIHFQKSGRYL
ncbi:hypothetical protein JTB14_023853 [Gonioctena quinquepunctata]|nr:hypothetical protein JTB14_023853 [Gonioctena quinquepunctata]